ncbi:hypothetical protein N7451_012622 [Penicillium sp. IBT 35674x]|nr:hypothetical protein N7451_012622 [Penicillium sp. IBT 35674x]
MRHAASKFTGVFELGMLITHSRTGTALDALYRPPQDPHREPKNALSRPSRRFYITELSTQTSRNHEATPLGPQYHQLSHPR